MLKAISDLERVGDKARKIARLGIELASQSAGSSFNVELKHMAETSLRMLRLALDGFARLDVKLVTEAMRLDEAVNAEYKAIARQLITYMMEDPRTITRSLDAMSIAKAIERIGDHATNIGEYVVFMVKGLNVRHASTEEIETQLAKDD